MYYSFTLRSLYNSVEGYYKAVERRETVLLQCARLQSFYTLKASTKKFTVSRADHLFALPSDKQDHKQPQAQSQEDFETWQEEMKAIVARDLKQMNK